MAVPFQVPEVMVPTLVKDEFTTVDPRVVLLNTELLLIRNDFPDAKLRLPVELTVPEPLFGERVMLPVVVPPTVKVCCAVVWSDPSAAI